MKILTINTHSLQEENYEQKLQWFIEGILKEKPDIIAMQEVNQTADAPLMEPELLAGQYPIPGALPVRQDNHAANVALRLWQAGVRCNWAWVPIKLGYGKYDEGVAILSLGRPIRCVDQFPISKVRDYRNWRTRAVLGVQVEGHPDWFYTVHMGWWEDEQEPFLAQWKVLNAFVTTKPRHAPVWLMGDFNSPAEVRGEGYDKIAATGWNDTFRSAREHDSGLTVPGVIDGWRGKMADTAAEGMRIDLIWCSLPEKIAASRVVFNGGNHPTVSDHFGVMIKTMPHGNEPSKQPESPWGDFDSDMEDDE